MDDSDRKARARRTIKSLRLDIDSATEGRTWLLLPEGFRDLGFGSTYPLPTNQDDLRRLATIPIPRAKHDSGCVYLNRVIKALRHWSRHRQNSILEGERQRMRLQHAESRTKSELVRMQNEARAEVDKVRQAAAESIASLTDLFALGRKGIEAQMQAHLNGSDWQGEPINARAFRECFRMVSQAVKGLGLPSGQRTEATQTIMDEVAAAIDATRDTIAPIPVPPSPDEVEH